MTPTGNDDGPDDEVGGSTDDAVAAPSAEVIRRRRLLVAAAGLVVLVILVAILVGRGDKDEQATPVARTALRVSAWAPYWAFDDSTADLDAHADVVEEVSPFVYTATGATEVALDPSADPAAVRRFVATARDHGLDVTPSIVDGMETGGMAAMLADPASRAEHVDTIATLADDIDADGIDIDYEAFAFRDPRRSWDTTRPVFASFVEELATRLHADGRTLAVSMPPVYDAGTSPDSGYWVYDYERIAAAADEVRVMAYDYSGQEAGPIAPLDWVHQVVDGVVEASGRPDVISLGIPLYGNNVPIATDGVCPDEAEGRTPVTIRSVEDLIARRGAVPVYDPATDEWGFEYQLDVGLDDDDPDTGCTQTRRVTYVDGAGAANRVRVAAEAGLGGVTLWALGYEDDTFWTALDGVL